MKLKHQVKWFKEIKAQFVYGGEKYAHSTRKEATDCLFEDFGKNWLFGTLAKYCKRYTNKARERDLLKIACYVFIIWLKRGFHLYKKGTEYTVNTTVENKSKYFETFCQRVFHFMLDFDTVYISSTKNALECVYKLLTVFSQLNFQKIGEKALFEIFALCYFIWEVDVPDAKKGHDQDLVNPGDKDKEKNNG